MLSWLYLGLIYLEELTMEDQNKRQELTTDIANKSMLDLKHLCTFSDVRSCHANLKLVYLGVRGSKFQISLTR